MFKERSVIDRRTNPDRRKSEDSEHTDTEKRKTEYRRLDIERRKKEE